MILVEAKELYFYKILKIKKLVTFLLSSFLHSCLKLLNCFKYQLENAMSI